MDAPDSSYAIKRKQEVAGIFHRASSTYGRVGPGFFAHFGRNLVQHSNLRRSARVLDVACGRGAVLFPAAETVGPNGSVVGIDFAEGMVRETSQEAIDRGFVNVEVRQMDAEHLDFADSTFDVVLCGFAIFFFPQLERALAEFRRVLKPGGRVAVSTWGTQFDADFDWFDELVKQYLPPAPQEDNANESSRSPDFETPAGMEKIMQLAGFANTRILSEIADFTYANAEEWWASRWSHGGRARLERIEKNGGVEALARFKTECLQQLEARKGSKNLGQSFQVLYTVALKS